VELHAEGREKTTAGRGQASQARDSIPSIGPAFPNDQTMAAFWGYSSTESWHGWCSIPCHDL